MVEQNASIALGVADYGYVMEGGRVVLEGPARELRNNPDVKEVLYGHVRGRRAKIFLKILSRTKGGKRWM